MMELAGMSEKADDLRGLSSAVSLWLIVLVGATAFYFTSSGHEILVQASESWSAAIRLLLAQAMLVFTANRHLTDRAQFFGVRLVTALLASIPLILIAIAFWASSHEYAKGPHAAINRLGWLYCVGFLAITLGITVLRRSRDPGAARKGGMFARGILAAFVVTAFFPSFMGSLMGVAICIALAGCFVLTLSWTFAGLRDRFRSADTFGGRLAHAALEFAPPVMFVWFVIGLAFNTHKTRNFEHDAKTLREYSLWQMTLDDSIAHWYSQHKGADGVTSMVIVESAGGGQRAAYWTSSVLFTLDRVGGFREHLFAISSVSGGSLGATLYRAAIAANTRSPNTASDAYKRFYAHDFLGPLTAGWLYSDLSSTFLPIGLFPDRAEALERSWETAWKAEWRGSEFSQEFRRLWPPLPSDYKRGDDLPMDRWPHLILNGSSLDEGNVLVTSDIKSLSFGSETLQRVEDVAPLRFPTSTAVDNSARFPILGPPGMILFEKGTLQAYLHATGLPVEKVTNALQDIVVDGGYVDNFGAYSMAEILDHVKHFNCALHRRSLLFDKTAPVNTTGCESYERSDLTPGIVPIVIQITSDPSLLRSSMQPNECLDAPAGWKVRPPGIQTTHDAAPFVEVAAPAIAMDQMRQRNGIVFASALADRSDIAAYFHFGIGPPYPVSGVLQRTEPPPSLNWTLSQHSMNQLDSFLTQCENLQAQELAILVRDPHQAAASTMRRKRLAHLVH
jgi:hypothetical protein